MNLLSLVDRAVCLTCDARWPGRWERVRDEWAAHGITVTPWLNGLPEESGTPTDRYQQINNVPKPPGWPTSQNAWNHLRAMRGIFQEALRDGVRNLLFLEDDCELTAEFPALVAATELPEDWELCYFGAYHWGRTDEVATTLLRVWGSMTTHAVIFGSAAMEAFLAMPPTQPDDMLIASYLQRRGHAYAIWPSVAIQSYDVSLMTGQLGGWPELFQTKGNNWPTPK